MPGGFMSNVDPVANGPFSAMRSMPAFQFVQPATSSNRRHRASGEAVVAMLAVSVHMVFSPGVVMSLQALDGRVLTAFCQQGGRMAMTGLLTTTCEGGGIRHAADFSGTRSRA